MKIAHNVELTHGKGGAHFFFQPPNDPNFFYECFNFAAGTKDTDRPGWVVLGWVVHRDSPEDEGDNECVEAYDDFKDDFNAALAKFYEIVKEKNQ